MAVYKWRAGSRVKCDAQAAGELCARLEVAGGLTPSALVDASRAEDAPLHSCFEWNDAEAAERYREVQAGYIIRSIVVVASGDAEPVKAFVSVSMGSERAYIGTEIALMEAETRDEVLANALAELRAFERKYSRLNELADVLSAIRKVA